MTSIKNLELIKLLPYFLQTDEEIKIMMQVIQEEFDLINEREQQEKLFIYGNFEDLEESILDELAYQWKTEGYEQSLPKEIKAKLVEGTYLVHKTKGTTYAVEKVLQDVHGDFDLMEWFEYDGDPYHFKVVAQESMPSIEIANKIAKLVHRSKNERSEYEGLIVSSRLDNNIKTALLNTDSGIDQAGLNRGEFFRLNTHRLQQAILESYSDDREYDRLIYDEMLYIYKEIKKALIYSSGGVNEVRTYTDLTINKTNYKTKAFELGARHEEYGFSEKLSFDNMYLAFCQVDRKYEEIICEVVDI